MSTPQVVRLKVACLAGDQDNEATHGHYATRWGPRQHRWERKEASLRTSFSHDASQQPTALGRIARQEPVSEAVMIPLPVRGLSSLVGYATLRPHSGQAVRRRTKE